MGLGPTELHFLLNEHKYRPIEGQVLCIGRQNTSFTEESALGFIASHGVVKRHGGFIELDSATGHGNKGQYLSDSSLFSLFSDGALYAADIDAYEGADFIFDICGDVPPELKGRFDFVMDGGSLDNVFDPLAMMRNMASMLKPGGRLFLTPFINSHPTAYVKLSPDWVMDYFAVNEWEDAKVYILSSRLNGSPISMWRYEPHIRKNAYQVSSLTAANQMQLLAIGEIGPQSTITRTAIQQHYRKDQKEPYLSSATRFAASPRPLYSFPGWDAPQAFELSNLNGMQHVATWPY